MEMFPGRTAIYKGARAKSIQFGYVTGAKENSGQTFSAMANNDNDNVANRHYLRLDESAVMLFGHSLHGRNWQFCY